jgi:hypothetical protein
MIMSDSDWTEQSKAAWHDTKLRIRQLYLLIKTQEKISEKMRS